MKNPILGQVRGRPGRIVRGALDVLRHPTGGIERVPMVVATGRRAGPVLWVLANIHGDEVTGVLAVHEWMARALDPARLAGSVVVVPSLNPAGLRVAARAPYYEEKDPNRLFPDPAPAAAAGDDPPGPQEGFFAALFEALAATADLVVDLHCSWLQSLPHTILDRVIYRRPADRPAAERLAARAQSLAHAFGLTVVREWEVARYLRRDLHRSVAGAAQNGARIPALTVELGARLVADPAALAAGVTGLGNVLRWAGMVPSAIGPIAQVPVVRPPYPLLRAEHPRCPEGGIVRFLVRPGERVEAGAPVATLRDVWGRPLAGGVVRTEQAGWVLGLNQGVAFYRNAVLAQLAVRDGAAAVARDARAAPMARRRGGARAGRGR